MAKPFFKGKIYTTKQVKPVIKPSNEEVLKQLEIVFQATPPSPKCECGADLTAYAAKCDSCMFEDADPKVVEQVEAEQQADNAITIADQSLGNATEAVLKKIGVPFRVFESNVTETPGVLAHKALAEKEKRMREEVQERITKPLVQEVLSKLVVPKEASTNNLIIKALAGTGKTTTLIDGMFYVKNIEPRGRKPIIKPSAQQKAIWDALRNGIEHARTIAFVAFGRDIAATLKTRVPSGVDAMTCHSMGFKAITSQYQLLPGNDAVQYERVENIIEEILNTPIRQLMKEKGPVIRGVKALVEKCKMNLLIVSDRSLETGMTIDEQLDALVDHYDIDLEDDNGKSYRNDVYPLVPLVLERCKDVAKDRYIDFADMIWLPIVLNLPMKKYDLLLVDECQDLNRCQQALIKKASKRLVIVGDVNQAIFGFAGADAESMERLEKELQGVVLPLTVSHRCSKAVTRDAKEIVPEFECLPDAAEGSSTTAKYTSYKKGDRLIEREPKDTYLPQVKCGDMLICRFNAPLISQYFKLIKLGMPAHILGKEVGEGLKKLIKRLDKDGTTVSLVGALSDWYMEEVAKEKAKRIPSESKLTNIKDKYDCVMFFTEESDKVDDILYRFDQIFVKDDNKEAVRLSSIHKAKGLEAETVFLLEPDDMPKMRCKKAWQSKQEDNLRYVAITRAILNIVYVRS